MRIFEADDMSTTRDFAQNIDADHMYGKVFEYAKHCYCHAAVEVIFNLMIIGVQNEGAVPVSASPEV